MCDTTNVIIELMRIALIEKTELIVSLQEDEMDIFTITKKHFGETLCKYVSLSEILQEYSKYGMYYLIIPFIEEVLIICEDESVYINDVITNLPDGVFLQKTLENYHKSMLPLYERQMQMGFASLKEALLRTPITSPARKYAMVWKSYDSELFPKIADNSKKNVGIWTPCFFLDGIDGSILDHLNNEAFIGLKNAIATFRQNAPSGYHLSSKIICLKAIIERQLRCFISEIGFWYGGLIGNTFYNFLGINIDAFSQLCGAELKGLLFPQGNQRYSLLEYEKSWVQGLENLCLLAESWFGSETPSNVMALKTHIPFLYQLIDENTIAEQKLLQLFDNDDYAKVILMSCTIALAKTNDTDIRNKIRYYLEDRYCIGKKGTNIKAYLSLLDDIISYFSIYFNHIRDYIKQDGDEWLQARWTSIKAENTFQLLTTEESFVWFYQVLISNNVFLDKMRFCRSKIDGARDPMIDASDYIVLSHSLFGAVSSHIDSSPRVDAKGILRLLGLTYREDCETHEVFYPDEYYDQRTHKTLDDRFTAISPKLTYSHYAIWAKTVIKVYCQGDAIIMRELISACAKISDGFEDYKLFSEDGLNRQIRNLLDASLRQHGYSVCDQTQQGSGRNGNQPGELDIRIQRGGIPVTIYEGLVDYGASYLREHIKKAINRYNYSGCTAVYVIEFFREGNFIDKWQHATVTVREYANDLKAVDTSLNGVKMARGTCQWGEMNSADLTFIGVNCTPME